MKLHDPTFPPLFRGTPIAADKSAFEAACARTAAGKLGAGDVLWSRNPYNVDLAIVLEPDVPPAQACQMIPLCMVAIGDCIGSLVPPQVGLTFTWPDIIRLNGGRAGRVRAAIPEGGSPDEPPRWLVIGLTLRHKPAPKDDEPGKRPEITWLSEEGGGELTRTDLIESFSRHFLTWLNQWDEDGFLPVHDSWLFRAEERNADISFEADGEKLTTTFLGIDENGNLLVKKNGKTQCYLLLDRVERRRAGR